MISSADIAIVVVVLLALAAGAMRGLFRELIAFVALVAGAYLAIAHTEDMLVGLNLADSSNDYKFVAYIVVAAVIFLACFAAGAVLNGTLGRAADAGLGPAVKRVGGAAVGVARGVFLSAVLIALGALSDAPHAGWWRSSNLIPMVQPLAAGAVALLPDERSRHFDFGD